MIWVRGVRVEAAHIVDLRVRLRGLDPVCTCGQVLTVDEWRCPHARTVSVRQGE